LRHQTGLGLALCLIKRSWISIQLFDKGALSARFQN
jgi:hypothetical protein